MKTDTNKVREAYRKYWNEEVDASNDSDEDSGFPEIDVDLANELAEYAVQLADELDTLRNISGGEIEKDVRVARVLVHLNSGKVLSVVDDHPTIQELMRDGKTDTIVLTQNRELTPIYVIPKSSIEYFELI